MLDTNSNIAPDGLKEWRNARGKLHREEGPAVEYPDGSKEWWVDGATARTAPRSSRLTGRRNGGNMDGGTGRMPRLENTPPARRNGGSAAYVTAKTAQPSNTLTARSDGTETD